MAEPKTKVTDVDPKDFLKSVTEEQKRKDSFVLFEMFSKITGEKARMWGTSIIGFGMFHYKSERSSQEGDWPLVGFSPRKANLSIYVMSTFTDPGLLAKLGKHKKTMGCIYINKFSDVNMEILKKIIKKSYEDSKKNHLSK